MIGTVMALLLGSAQAPDEPIMRTLFACEAGKLQADSTAARKQQRRFSILLNGFGKFEPIDTLDPDRVLEGSKIREFRVSKLEPLEMVAHSGAGDPKVWLMVLKAKKIGAIDGYDLDLIDDKETRFGGFCMAFRKVTTLADLRAHAEKWTATK